MSTDAERPMGIKLAESFNPCDRVLEVYRLTNYLVSEGISRKEALDTSLCAVYGLVDDGVAAVESAGEKEKAATGAASGEGQLICVTIKDGRGINPHGFCAALQAFFDAQLPLEKKPANCVMSCGLLDEEPIEFSFYGPK